ncbi:MAG: phosphatidate cytidylyltransferase [Candidatus Marinimicrobia bacterium]|nr:phosphatidate cytidylyltransferase [Candidatus Neomarinimicrobiota bacterium]
MMKGRNTINAIGVPLWIFLIWKGGLYYSIFMLMCTVIALGEFYRLMEKKGAQPLRWMGMASTVFIADYYYVQPLITAHQLLGGVIMIIILTSIWELFSMRENPGQNISATLAGILFVSVLLGTAIDIRQFDHLMNTQLTLALTLAVWICDTAAFIFGTLFGKKKIFPSVSPNKSWAGSISGLIAAQVVILIFHHQGWLGDYFSLNDAIVFGLISGLFGQLGDFTESLLKRDAGVKDSGTLLAGHGGVLDRFDSLIFAMPLAYLYIHFLMHI